MKRRTLLQRMGQVAAGLGLAGLVAKEAAPVEAAPAPLAAGDVLSMTPVASTLRPPFEYPRAERFPDLLERGIRQVYFNDRDARILPWLMQQEYLKRQSWQMKTRRPPKRRRM